MNVDRECVRISMHPMCAVSKAQGAVHGARWHALAVRHGGGNAHFIEVTSVPVNAFVCKAYTDRTILMKPSLAPFDHYCVRSNAHIYQ